jgi:hypothetical protein
MKVIYFGSQALKARFKFKVFLNEIKLDKTGLKKIKLPFIERSFSLHKGRRRWDGGLRQHSSSGMTNALDRTVTDKLYQS